MNYLHYIGIDVSKNWFDAAIFEGAAKPQRFVNSSAGFAAFVEAHKDVISQSFVVLESTGGYENALVAHLLSCAIAVHKAQPLAAKHFIRSLGKRAKTDTLDAIALARYGAERHAELAVVQPTSYAAQMLSTLLMRRADVLGIRTAETNRLQHPNYANVQEKVQAMLDLCERQLTEIEQEIDALIANCPTTTQKIATLTSVKGVGKTTAIALLGAMPELGTLTRRQAASLAGCAPHPKESGLKQGYRRTSGGRACVKKAYSWPQSLHHDLTKHCMNFTPDSSPQVKRKWLLLPQSCENSSQSLMLNSTIYLLVDNQFNMVDDGTKKRALRIYYLRCSSRKMDCPKRCKTLASSGSVSG